MNGYVGLMKWITPTIKEELEHEIILTRNDWRVGTRNTMLQWFPLVFYPRFHIDLWLFTDFYFNNLNENNNRRISVMSDNSLIYTV